MCGIAGVLDPTASTSVEEVGAMTDALAHRGPDDRGVVVEDDGRVLLGARRLAIRDLSAHGHQPMVSACGRWVVAYNGELYGTDELRRELAATGHRFRGHADTELLLASVSRWGLRGALERFDGMFAFALWDRERRELHLVRDRLGEKPLCVARQDGLLLFGSELWSLRAHPRFRPRVDRDAVTLLLRHTYLPAPHCIYEGVTKVRPGTVVTVGADGMARETTYWAAADVMGRPAARPSDEEEAFAEVERLLRRSVVRRTVADVPVGVLLSGGLDSSAVLALLAEEATGPVRTFTIGFDDAGLDEAPFARQVADRFGADHTELYVSSSEARAVVPRLAQVYDEPFADQSAIPTVLLAELARRHVTVALTGDGGDELFGGYHHHLRPWRPRALDRFPPGLRRPAAASLGGRWTEWVDGAWRRAPLPARWRNRRPGRPLRAVAARLREPDAAARHRRAMASWAGPEAVVPGATVTATAFDGTVGPTPARDPVGWMMALDTTTFLPDDILVKMDRAAMAVGLENRSPFLDHRLFDAAWRLPVAARVRDGVGKRPLRWLLRDRLPAELIDRPKMGFNTPIGDWLRGPLRPWAEEVLSMPSGPLDLAPARAAWREHQAAERDAAYQLWPVLVLLSWIDHHEPGGWWD